MDKDLIILILGLVLLVSLGVIFFLITRLKKEKDRGQKPLLSLRPNLEPLQLGLYVQNISGIPAKDILVKDIDVIIEANIGGAVTLKFDPVNLLPAQTEQKLSFKVFSGAFPIAHITSDNVIPHLTGTPIEAHIAYNSVHNIRFEAVLKQEKDTNQFTLKELKTVS